MTEEKSIDPRRNELSIALAICEDKVDKDYHITERARLAALNVLAHMDRIYKMSDREELRDGPNTAWSNIYTLLHSGRAERESQESNLFKAAPAFMQEAEPLAINLWQGGYGPRPDETDYGSETYLDIEYQGPYGWKELLPVNETYLKMLEHLGKIEKRVDMRQKYFITESLHDALQVICYGDMKTVSKHMGIGRPTLYKYLNRTQKYLLTKTLNLVETYFSKYHAGRYSIYITDEGNVGCKELAYGKTKDVNLGSKLHMGYLRVNTPSLKAMPLEDFNKLTFEEMMFTHLEPELVKYAKMQKEHIDNKYDAEGKREEIRDAGGIPCYSLTKFQGYTSVEDFLADRNPMMHQPAPLDLTKKDAENAFGLLVNTDEFRPLAGKNRIIIVLPGQPMKNGDLAIIQAANDMYEMNTTEIGTINYLDEKEGEDFELATFADVPSPEDAVGDTYRAECRETFMGNFEDGWTAHDNKGEVYKTVIQSLRIHPTQINFNLEG